MSGVARIAQTGAEWGIAYSCRAKTNASPTNATPVSPGSAPTRHHLTTQTGCFPTTDCSSLSSSPSSPPPPAFANHHEPGFFFPLQAFCRASSRCNIHILFLSSHGESSSLREDQALLNPSLLIVAKYMINRPCILFQPVSLDPLIPSHKYHRRDLQITPFSLPNKGMSASKMTVAALAVSMALWPFPFLCANCSCTV